MRRAMVPVFGVVAILTLGTALLFAMREYREDKGSDGKLPFISPEGTFELEIEGTSVTLGELLARNRIATEAVSFRAYTERGEVQRVQLGTTLHLEDGRTRFDDGTALIGVAAEGSGGAGTLMSLAPTVLSSLNITHSLKEQPFSRVRVERVVVLELDGLGWALVQSRGGALANISRLGNASCALTAFPPRTPTGTAMALTGHDMLHNGILTENDRSLSRQTFLELANGSGRSTVWVEGDRSILTSGAELNADINGDGSVDDEVFGSLMGHLDGGAEVALAHFHSIDEEFHASGSGSDHLSDAISRVDSYVGGVLDHLEGSRTPSLLVLFSDHGLHDVGGGTGEHGSFGHEDMYAFTAFKAFGTSVKEVPPSISLMFDGTVVNTLEMAEMEALPFIEGTFQVRSSRGEDTSLFRGVLVCDLLNVTLGQAPFSSLTFTSGDGLSISLPSEWTTEGSVTMVSYEKDGAPIPDGEGPFRLIVPQELAGEYNGQYCLKDVISMEVAS